MSESPTITQRLRQSLKLRWQGAAIDAGMRAYRPIESLSIQGWDARHRSGDWDRLTEVAELARYSVIAGYVRFFGPARSLLDVGCGSGLLLERLSRSDFDAYLGMDVSRSGIARARQLEDRDRVRFSVGELPTTTDDKFDFIICNEVLYYVPDPGVMIREISNLLDPAGYLLTSIWRHRGDNALQRLIKTRFELVDLVELRAGRRPRRWRTRVACWRPARADG